MDNSDEDFVPGSFVNPISKPKSQLAKRKTKKTYNEIPSFELNNPYHEHVLGVSVKAVSRKQPTSKETVTSTVTSVSTVSRQSQTLPAVTPVSQPMSEWSGPDSLSPGPHSTQH